MDLLSGDCLDLLPQLPAGSVQCVYWDPPFNTGRDFVDFGDRFESSEGYTAFMRERCIQIERVMADCSVLWLHCDHKAAHHLRIMLDGVFGEQAFLNQIIWQRQGSHSMSAFGNVCDHLLIYGKGGFKFSRDNEHCRVELRPEYIKSDYRREDERGRRQGMKLKGFGKTDTMRYKGNAMLGGGASTGESGRPWRGYFPPNGSHWSPPKTGDYAKWIDANVIPGYMEMDSTHARMDALDAAGLIYYTKTRPVLKRYLIPGQKKVLPNLWTDIRPLNSMAVERKAADKYATQKPVQLLKRIIGASTAEGDLVLDPMCGSGTSGVAALELGRRFIGMDANPVAVDIARRRTGTGAA